MQLSREGSGCGGRCHHRHHYHRSPPADPLTIDSTNPAPHHRRRNCHDHAKSSGRRYRGSVDGKLLLLGERKCYRSGSAEELPEGAAAGVRVLALGHYSRGSGGVEEGARGGVAGGGVTAGADPRHDERFCDRRGERRHGQGQEQALPEW